MFARDVSSTLKAAAVPMLLALAAAPMPSVALAAPGHSAAVPAAACDGGWQLQASPNPGTLANYLLGVSAVSPRDVWAVGSYSSGPGTNGFVEHWDGVSWQVVASPAEPNGGALFGVTAISAHDAWAVGGAYVGGLNRAVAEHWDGQSWQVIPTVSVGAASSLVSVAAASPTDVWAVGWWDDSAFTSHTLIQHWNGSAWSVVSSPGVGTGWNALTGVAVQPAGGANGAASDVVWAVGRYLNNMTGSVQTLAELWRSGVWTVVPTVNSGTGDSGLSAVAAVAHGGSDDSSVWAVGWSSNTAHTMNTALIESWNGERWRLEPVAASAQRSEALFGVAAVSADDVVAAGSLSVEGAAARTLVVQSRGDQWQQAPTHSIGPADNQLFAVSTAGQAAVAVGYHAGNGGFAATEVQRRCPAD